LRLKVPTTTIKGKGPINGWDVYAMGGVRENHVQISMDILNLVGRSGFTFIIMDPLHLSPTPALFIFNGSGVVEIRKSQRKGSMWI